MVVYDRSTIGELVAKYGEVFFVLDSGEEVEVHGRNGYELYDLDTGETFIRVEGMRDDEYVVLEAPVESIEHHYTHKEI